MLRDKVDLDYKQQLDPTIHSIQPSIGYNWNVEKTVREPLLDTKNASYIKEVDK